MQGTTIAKILDRVPALIQAAEEAIADPDMGRAKLNAVLKAILVMVPPPMLVEFMEKTWPKIESYIAILVEFYKAVGYFKSRKATPGGPQS